MDLSTYIDSYHRYGWCRIPSYHDDSWTDVCGTIGLQLKHRAHELSDWKGISCAGRFDPRLTEMYTDKKMYDLAIQFLGEDVYLFNDQIVYKLPEEHFCFDPHYDNQYGPNADNKIHTVNFSCALDEFESSLEIQDERGWHVFYPCKGDVIAIRGDTYHRSPIHLGTRPRGLYACVYTAEPLYKKDFYYSKFTPDLISSSYIDVTK